MCSAILKQDMTIHADINLSISTGLCADYYDTCKTKEKHWFDKTIHKHISLPHIVVEGYMYGRFLFKPLMMATENSSLDSARKKSVIAAGSFAIPEY